MVPHPKLRKPAPRLATPAIRKNMLLLWKKEPELRPKIHPVCTQVRGTDVTAESGADGAAAADLRTDFGEQAAGRLPVGQAHQHEEGHPLHRQPVPQGQDLAAADQAQQAAIPGESAGDNQPGPFLARDWVSNLEVAWALS